MTISVPLPTDLARRLMDFLRDKKTDNKAAVMRVALEKYLEDQAVEDVLRASREPRLSGDLDELAKKL
jgi:predicted DNA-binding protein